MKKQPIKNNRGEKNLSVQAGTSKQTNSNLSLILTVDPIICLRDIKELKLKNE